MDSISMMGCSRSPLFLTASSSHHLHHSQACMLPNGVRNRATDSGTFCLMPAQPTVAILGSGDFSKCLTTRLLRCGFSVVVGSRHPKMAAQSFPHVVDVTHYEDAVGKASIVFLAIRREHYSVLWDLKHLMEGKVLVDVSNNRRVNQYPESNAEYLASLLPESLVVKGFNVISAWAMQQSYPIDASTQVFVCSDSVEARQEIMELARQLSFQPVDMGTLSSSREIENIPIQLFPGWKGPVLGAVALSIFFFAYSFLRDIIHPYVKYRQSDFYKIPIEIVNRTLPTVAITLLALVYLAGQLAAAHQLYYGTKYKHFPLWLEGWLQSRKQLGLISFFLAAIHVLYSLCLPLRRSERYLLLNTAYQQVHANVDNAWNEEEVWRVEMYVSFGIMSFGLMSLLAITSIPSINSKLNWREFSFIQDLARWPYLEKVNIPVIDSSIELLIGTNASKVIEPWEVINSQGEGLYAIKNLVGWVVNGPLRHGKSAIDDDCQSEAVNRISVANLEKLLISQYSHEFNEKTADEKREHSIEDKKFLDIANNSVSLIDGHYTLDLPFKDDNVKLPNNRPIALQRLHSLKRKLSRNPVFHDEYSAFLNHVIAQGYAEVVPQKELKGGISWTFNPPGASHHGGVWERLIRSVRWVLNALTHQQPLTDEGLQTLFCEVEAILNNRPITTASSDPFDLEPLTPNHILLFNTQPVLPPGEFSSTDLYTRCRWKQVQYLADLFWRRWTHEYLTLMQERQKWSKVRENLKTGDVVMIVDPTSPRSSWPLARILETKPDSEGLVRSVKLKTKTGVLERPITKLCLLLEDGT
ncbi:uncharacterized protein steap2 isoform 2-T3 [Odontesthes bonariensis]|uniref:uncharacterized protein steap2 isoform X2 n=1 Tax=Odontesthes bonariensis TaxID=219752 RepID=UPI003F58DF2C